MTEEKKKVDLDSNNQNHDKFKSIELINYQIVLKDNGNDPYDLIDIIDFTNNLKLSKGEFKNENISKLMYELISSRLASENLVEKMNNELEDLTKENAELIKQNDYILKKYNESEQFIEENRGKLEK